MRVQRDINVALLLLLRLLFLLLLLLLLLPSSSCFMTTPPPLLPPGKKQSALHPNPVSFLVCSGRARPGATALPFFVTSPLVQGNPL